MLVILATFYLFLFSICISQDDEAAKAKKKKKDQRGLEKLYGKAGTGPKSKGPAPGGKPKPAPVEGQEEEEKERAPVDDETSMLPGLTGVPVVEDELLFAVPVVAPYNTLLQYKFKVKLTPGTGSGPRELSP